MRREPNPDLRNYTSERLDTLYDDLSELLKRAYSIPEKRVKLTAFFSYLKQKKNHS
jgi:hypothetical protein